MSSKWIRFRFQADADDPRPVIVPTPAPWWCTGYGNDYSIVIAYIPNQGDIEKSKALLREFWPEAHEFSFEDEKDEILFTDRFPQPEEWDEKNECWDCEASDKGVDMSDTITRHDLPNYVWREYEWLDPESKTIVVYRIDYPVALYTRVGGTTHRVEDAAGIMHITPAVGHFGCRLRYEKTEGAEKVRF